MFQTPFHSMTHHWSENKFATCGQQVDIWDEERSEPIRSFTWGVDSVGSVKFNPVEVTNCNNDSITIKYKNIMFGMFW